MVLNDGGEDMAAKALEFVGTWDAYEKGRKEEIKEVVDWLEQQTQKECPYCGSCHDLDDSGVLKTKLREWGL